jgi:tRNA nucleotidyltransferase (CCA-adding enzyme)
MLNNLSRDLFSVFGKRQNPKTEKSKSQVYRAEKRKDNAMNTNNTTPTTAPAPTTTAPATTGMILPCFVKKVVCVLKENGATPYIVGGAVRDYVLGINPKDYDIEAHGISIENVESALARAGIKSDTIGKSYGIVVAKSDHDSVEIAIPRKDSRIGIAHKDFKCEFDINMNIREALSRRDFTMNAMALEPFGNRLIDPFNGAEDIENGIIRHTSDKFAEDPLRVLRGAQFAARFGFSCAKDTMDICSSIADEHRSIAVDRIRAEWTKLLLGKYPSHGLWFLHCAGWLKNYPQINALVGLKQNPEIHPEGCVFEHTMQCVDRMRIKLDEKEEESGEKLKMMMAALCHDFGKATTTGTSDSGKITSYGHDVDGEEPTVEFLDSIGFTSEKVKKPIVNLVKHHMFGMNCNGNPTHSALARLALKIAPATISELATLMIADASARYPVSSTADARIEVIPEYASVMGSVAVQEKVRCDTIKIVTGKTCVEAGIIPGPEVGKMIAAAFKAQLDGAFSTEPGGRLWVIERASSSR